jgi:hypothetical protein
MGLMRSGLCRSGASGPHLRALPLVLATVLVVAWLALAPRALAAGVQSSSTAPKPLVSATLEQCVTSPEQAERTATFAGEMLAVPGTAKMEMRIEVLERQPKELLFHAVTAPGLGVWRVAAPGVKTYRYLKEVTNLSAPASYRAAVRFRWLGAKGKLIRAQELRTPRCLQPVVPAEPVPPAA